MNQIKEEIKQYIEKIVFPEYQKNDKGHNNKHIDYVIRRSFEIIEQNKPILINSFVEFLKVNDLLK